MGDRPVTALTTRIKTAGRALIFDGLTLGYERHPAVHHLTGSVGQGELLALVGPNGAGKSTLLKGVMGILKPLAGTMIRPGTESQSIAYLPQLSEIDRSFPLRLLDLVSMGLWRDIAGWRSVGRSRERRALDALGAVGLGGFENRLIGSLSGGQFQRALFARLLLQDASIVLLDEPFAAIDTRTVADLLAIIRNWHTEGRTVVAAIHDLEQVRSHFPRTLLLAREPVAWGDTADTLTENNLMRARDLCEAWDENADVCERGGHDAEAAHDV